jgi:hypothetical protein
MFKSLLHPCPGGFTVTGVLFRISRNYKILQRIYLLQQEVAITFTSGRLRDMILRRINASIPPKG